MGFRSMFRSSLVIFAICAGFLLALSYSTTLAAEGLVVLQTAVVSNDLDGYVVAYVVRNTTAHRIDVARIDCALYADDKLINVVMDAIAPFPAFTTVSGTARSPSLISQKPGKVECEVRGN
jgi:hypothetical protein